MVEKVPEFSAESLCLRQGMVTKAEILPKIRELFPPLFDSVCRIFHQKLCFQSPKTFTPKMYY